jgi:hypothetical protein
MLWAGLCISLPTVKADVVPLNWTSPTTSSLLSVFMVSATDGWAVGAFGTIVRWDGINWANVASPTTYDLWSVFMVSVTDGWAVGGRNPGETIIHWDGTNWSNVTTPTTNSLASVFIVGASDGWAVGYLGTIIRWNGTEWVVPEFPTVIPMSLLMIVTLIAAILTKTASKKHITDFHSFY